MSLVDLLGKLPPEPPEERAPIDSPTAVLTELSRDATVVTLEVAAASHDIRALDDRADVLRAEIVELERRRAALAGEIALERAALRTAREEVSAELHRAEQLHESATRAEVEASLHRVTSDDAVRRAETAHAELTDAEHRVATLRAELTHVQDLVAQAEVRHVAAQRSLSATEDDLRARLAPLETAVAEAQTRHDRLERGVALLRHEHEALLTALDAFTPGDPSPRASRLARQLVADDVDRLTAELTARRADDEVLQRRADELSRSADELLQSNAALVASCGELRADIDAARAERVRLAEEVSRLEQDRARLRAETDVVVALRDDAVATINAARREHQDLAVRTAGRMRELADRQTRLDREVAERVRLELCRREERLRSTRLFARRRLWKAMLRGDQS